jgi:serine/threonine-protein kinase
MVDQVGRYIVKGQIGKGAMGVVYLAEDPLLGRQAAIKTVDLSVEDPAERDLLRHRLLRDARAAAGLTHPNIVSVYDVVEESDSAYLVLEFVPGGTLAARLIATPIPDYGFTTFVLRGMAAALDYTHARGIVHRDVKPANVMITPDGAPKIMDFGIARIADSRTNTPTGTVMGTIDYMSPEQIRGERLDGRSDQFALGALAVRMLSGQTLYGKHSLPTLAYKIVNEPVPPIHTRNASLPPAVDAVIARSLAKTAAERYPTCAQFAQDLATALAMDVAEPPTRTLSMPAAALAVVPTAPMPVTPAPAYAVAPTSQDASAPAFSVARRPQTKKRPMGVIGVIAAGFAVLVAGAGLVMWRTSKSSAAPVESVSPSAAAVNKPAEVSEPPVSTPSSAPAPVESAKPATTASERSAPANTALGG